MEGFTVGSISSFSPSYLNTLKACSREPRKPLSATKGFGIKELLAAAVFQLLSGLFAFGAAVKMHFPCDPLRPLFPISRAPSPVFSPEAKSAAAVDARFNLFVYIFGCPTCSSGGVCSHLAAGRNVWK